uniref:Uncharacterized protein n=1 Tax=Ascaris lumbricoides TaxID=6252 RepID=A0A0M3IFT3_ASCLU
MTIVSLSLERKDRCKSSMAEVTEAIFYDLLSHILACCGGWKYSRLRTREVDLICRGKARKGFCEPHEAWAREYFIGEVNVSKTHQPSNGTLTSAHGSRAVGGMSRKRANIVGIVGPPKALQSSSLVTNTASMDL